MEAFFYGTLMQPEILQRVLGNNGSHLRICPAILKVGKPRYLHGSGSDILHKPRTLLGIKSKQVHGIVSVSRRLTSMVKGVTYPAIVPYSLSRSMFDRNLGPEEISVKGSLVSGLTNEEVRLLDVFEGDVSSNAVLNFGLLRFSLRQEYTRELVSVYPLGPLASLYDVPPAETTYITAQQPIKANAYVWCLSLTLLHPDRWSFEEFVQHHAWKWMGSEYGKSSEVDRRKAMEGTIVRARL